MKIRTKNQFWGLGVAVVVFAAPLALHAQSGQLPVKPGLWEMQTSSGAGAAPGAPAMPALPPDAEARIAALPPAQQAQVRAAMAGAMGGGAKPAPITTQSCIAPNTSMDSLLNQAQHRSSNAMKCSFTNRVQTARGASYDMSCTGPMGSAQGHTDYHLIDDEHFSSTVHITITAKGQSGQTMTMTRDATTTGKFVSADCGDVKPMGAAPAQ
jgi:hypothetical protein